MSKVGVILGSTRPGRLGDRVAAWVYDAAVRRTGIEAELIDLRDYPLAHLDEAPRARPETGSEQPAIQVWSATIARHDGYVIVSPEYNYSFPGVLKNALDVLYAEWNNKAVGFVSYGGVGGARAVQHLRSTCGALQMAAVSAQVAIPLMTEFDCREVFTPSADSLAALETMLDQLVAWSAALAPLRPCALPPKPVPAWPDRMEETR